MDLFQLPVRPGAHFSSKHGQRLMKTESAMSVYTDIHLNPIMASADRGY